LVPAFGASSALLPSPLPHLGPLATDRWLRFPQTEKVRLIYCSCVWSLSPVGGVIFRACNVPRLLARNSRKTMLATSPTLYRGALPSPPSTPGWSLAKASFAKKGQQSLNLRRMGRFLCLLRSLRAEFFPFTRHPQTPRNYFQTDAY